MVRLIIEQTILKQFINGDELVDFLLPNSTRYLHRLDLKEIKIGIGQADVGANVDYLRLEFYQPNSGLIGDNGNSVITVPSLLTPTTLYRQYQRDHLNILNNNAKHTTEKDLPIKFQIFKPDNTPLQKTFIYLRFNAFYYEGDIRHFDENIFNAQ